MVVGIAVLGTLVQARAAHEALRTLTAARVPNAGHLATTIAHNGAQRLSGARRASSDLLNEIGARSYVGGLHLAFGAAAIVMITAGVLAATLLGAPSTPPAQTGDAADR